MARARKKPEEKQVKNSQKPKIDDFGNVKRFMGGEYEVMVDTFKLETATMLKNISWTTKEMVNPIEHCHFFHTYDSNGKKMTECNAVGGHKHEIYLREENGQFIAECSPPIQSKKSEKISTQDRHVHKVVYVKSELLEMRKANVEAAKAMSYFMNPDNPEEL